MNRILLISYDLRGLESHSDYMLVIDYLKSFIDWAKPLKSLWFIETGKDPSVVRNEIMRITDLNDGLLVMDVTGANWATFGIKKSVTDWMKENI